MRARPYATTNPSLLAAALLEVAARIGLDGASVREVAGHAGVSVGAVQHHFPTKDQMLAFAFRTLADRVVDRLTSVALDDEPESALFSALSQLLPLDDERRADAQVLSAFSVRSATAPDLAAIAYTTMFTIRTGISTLLIRAGAEEAETRAALLLATVNGLALDAVANPQMYPPDYLTHALRTQIALCLTPVD